MASQFPILGSTIRIPIQKPGDPNRYRLRFGHPGFWMMFESGRAEDQATISGYRWKAPAAYFDVKKVSEAAYQMISLSFTGISILVLMN